MYYYIACEENKDVFNGLKESDILSKEIRQSFTYDELMKFIKKDLRNLEIRCLILDRSILDFQEGQNIQDILGTFHILNPESKIIVLTDASTAASGLGETENQRMVDIESIDKDDILRFIEGTAKQVSELEDEKTATEARIPKENKPKVDIPEDDTPEDLNLDYCRSEDIIPEATEPEDIALENTAADNQVHRIQKEHQVIEEEKPPEVEAVRKVKNERKPASRRSRYKAGEQMPLPDIPAEQPAPDALYRKAAAPNKISEGVPLKKRIAQLQGIEDKPEKEVQDTEKVIGMNSYTQDSSIQDHYMKDSVYHWNSNNIIIGVVGTERKVGTTWTSILLANYLTSKGARVSYFEANGHKHLESLAREFEFVKEADSYIYNGIHFYEKLYDTNANMNFILLDMGCIVNDDMKQLKILREGVDQIIMISGKRYYEQEKLLKSLSLIDKKEIAILFNNMAPEEAESIKDRYKLQAAHISWIPYEMNIDAPGEWPEDIMQIFRRYIAPAADHDRQLKECK